MAGSILRLFLSVLGAGSLYTLWMVVGIPGARTGPGPAAIAIFALAPIATATGYAVGMQLGEGLTARRAKGFRNAWGWALVGCLIGALVAYPFGPMLIVFGMFLVGTAAMVALGDNDPKWEEEYQKLGSTAGSYDDWHEGRDPAGISTQDPELMKRFDPVEGGRRLANYLRFLRILASSA